MTDRSGPGLAWDAEGRSQRLRRNAAAVPLRVLREPFLLSEVWHKVRARSVDRRHRTRVAAYARLATSPSAAVAQLLDVEPAAVEAWLRAPSARAVTERLERYRPPNHALPMGGPAFLDLAYALVRLLRPPIVVETGVAHGYSSAVLLHALAEAGDGVLYSVDLPAFRPGVRTHTGAAARFVLEETALDRWTLFVGPDRKVLPSLLPRIEPVVLCSYDSDKSYRGMTRSLELLWRSLAPGGVILVDDVEVHDGFLDFVQERTARWAVVAKPVCPPLYARSAFAGLVRRTEGS